MRLKNEKELNKLSNEKLLSEYHALIIEIAEESRCKQLKGRPEHIARLKEYQGLVHRIIVDRMSA